MPRPAAAKFAKESTLTLSPSPMAVVAAAALDATDAAGIPRGNADLIVVAVPAGHANDALVAKITAAAKA